MVDALREAHRILAPRGKLVDARPDSRVTARVRSRRADGPIIGTIDTQRLAKKDDDLSDVAVGVVRRQGIFRSARSGRLWHAIPFEHRAELQDYLDDHLRLSRRVRWRRRPADTEPLFVERAVRFQILEASPMA